MHRRTAPNRARLVFALVALACVTPALAETIEFDGLTYTGAQYRVTSFRNITNNVPTNVDAAANFTLTIVDLGATGGTSYVGFRFENEANAVSSARIEELYFYDGHLIENGVVLTPGVFTRYDNSVSPQDLPGLGEYITKANQKRSDPFHVTRFFAADAGNNGGGGLGVPVGGHVDLKFSVKAGVSFQTILDDLTSVLPPQTDHDFFVGIHVQSIGGTGKSDSFLANDVPPPPPPGEGGGVPLPATSATTLALFGVLASRRRQTRTQ